MSNLQSRTLAAAAQLQPVVVKRQCLTEANAKQLLPIADLRSRPAWLDRMGAASVLPTKVTSRRIASPSSALLRRLALCSDAASSVPFDLGKLWTELRADAAKVVETFHAGDQSYFLLTTGASSRSVENLGGQRLEIFERVLGGRSQKAVADELGVSPAQVSSALRDTLKAMGLACAPSSVPLQLKLAYRAAVQRQSVEGRLSRFHWQGTTYDVVSVRRVERPLAARLSPAEYEVVRLVFEGCSVEQIAARRGASVRTVANQVSNIFRKLNVTSRTELCELIVGAAVLEGHGQPQVEIPSAAEAVANDTIASTSVEL
jgi:DNA-binding NarL/FixJ family response regulator